MDLLNLLNVFVHFKDIQAAGLTSLSENQEVEYKLTEERGKTKATDIRIVS